ncbi:MAG: hypothetical protein ACI8QS_002874 [Planctomycetota bacterium]|jgi:hypothetical protein
MNPSFNLRDSPGSRPRRRSTGPDGGVPSWATWFIGPALLLSALLAFAILQVDQSTLFAVASLTGLSVLGLWVLTSILWPSRADRSCPDCGLDTLERMDLETTMGLRCGSCGFMDETLSSWFLAEEEGPLEEIVLAQRGRTKSRPRLSKVDSGSAASYESSRDR